jgi:transposase
MRRAPDVRLTQEDRAELERWVRSPTQQQRSVERARVVLLAAEGLENQVISDRLNIPVNRVGRWRSRFAESGLAGLRDLGGRGRKRVYGSMERLEVVAAATRQPEAETHWSARRLSEHLSESLGISYRTVHRILKGLDLKPHLVEQWLNSTDPDFDAKKADIAGLYINPPENGLVVSVDERTQMLVRQPTRPSKPMRPGQPERREFEYRRHGVQSLMAALLVHEGRIIGRVEETHSRVEFIRFLELIDAETDPGKDLHVILDNLQVHKTPEVKDWLQRHPRFHFHFTPTHASWLNQIEIWFSILGRRLLKRGIFTSKEDQAKQIAAFIDKYNRTARPFAWTSKGDVLAA